MLAYPDVREAVEWLTRVFGFQERLEIARHRSQMVFGGGAVIVAEYIYREDRPESGEMHARHSVIVRVPDVKAHFEHVRAQGAEILEEPTDHIYGERQYAVRDLGGHRWMFSETLSDENPDDWGGPDVVLKHPG